MMNTDSPDARQQRQLERFYAELNASATQRVSLLLYELAVVEEMARENRTDVTRGEVLESFKQKAQTHTLPYTARVIYHPRHYTGFLRELAEHIREFPENSTAAHSVELASYLTSLGYSGVIQLVRYISDSKVLLKELEKRMLTGASEAAGGPEDEGTAFYARYTLPFSDDVRGLWSMFYPQISPASERYTSGRSEARSKFLQWRMEREAAQRDQGALWRHDMRDGFPREEKEKEKELPEEEKVSAAPAPAPALKSALKKKTAGGVGASRVKRGDGLEQAWMYAHDSFVYACVRIYPVYVPKRDEGGPLTHGAHTLTVILKPSIREQSAKDDPHALLLLFLTLYALSDITESMAAESVTYVVKAPSAVLEKLKTHWLQPAAPSPSAITQALAAPGRLEISSILLSAIFSDAARAFEVARKHFRPTSHDLSQEFVFRGAHAPSSSSSSSSSSSRKETETEAETVEKGPPPTPDLKKKKNKGSPSPPTPGRKEVGRQSPN